MQICRKCKESKKLEEFNKNSSKLNGYHNVCRECMKLYLKKHYVRNTSYYRIKNDRLKSRNRNWLKSIKGKLKCEMCGESHLVCLDFHHNGLEEKDMSISRAVGNGWSIKRIKDEIKKCKVVCSNCHRRIHYSGID